MFVSFYTGVFNPIKLDNLKFNFNKLIAHRVWLYYTYNCRSVQLNRTLILSIIRLVTEQNKSGRQTLSIFDISKNKTVVETVLFFFSNNYCVNCSL